MNLEEYIAHWKLSLLRPNRRDVLVFIDNGANAFKITDNSTVNAASLSLSAHRLIKKLVTISKTNLKKTGVATLGLSHYAIKFELEGVNYYTPLFIQNAVATYSRIKNEYAIELQGVPFFNPFLEKIFRIKLPNFDVLHVEETLKKMGLDFELCNENYLGNFHPHRFIILKEVEELSKQNDYSNPLNQLFGNTISEEETIDLPNEQIGFTDGYQQAVITGLKTANIVLQGPPGTGKSDVIANVVTKCMAQNKNAILVAEQQTALNVIFEKLRTYDLHHFCAPIHHQLAAKDFVSSLKDTWQFIEHSSVSPSLSSNRSYYMVQQLQLLLDKLNAPSLYGGMEYSEFFKLCKGTESQSQIAVDVIPELKDWLKDKSVLQEVYPLLVQMNIPIWSFVHANLLLNKSRAIELINELSKSIAALNPLLKQIDEVETVYQQSLYVQLFFYDDKLLDLALFDTSSKKHKQFCQLYNELQTCEDKLAFYQSEKDNWKKELNESELLDFISVLSKKDTFSLSNWLKKRAIKQQTPLDLEQAKGALNRLLELKGLEKDHINCKSELRELGLPDDLQSLTQIHLLIQRSASFSDNRFKAILQQGNSAILALYEKRKEIEFVKDFSKNYLLFKPKIDWQLFIQEFKANQAELFGMADTLANISQASKKLMYQLFPDFTIDQLEGIVVNGHWKYLQAKFPQLTALTPKQFSNQLDAILIQAKQDHKDFANDIICSIKEKFNHAHELLQTPARKLNTQQKERKARLRKGKSILVKQFAKSRNHLSPLELFSSEAAEWIAILKPVLAGSSLAVGENLPFVKASFDLVLFDEASQMHLSHAVGSLFRAKRVLIAGDSQQMPPSNLFNRGAQDIDLLSQATFYWKSIQLQHHYRSHHEELISFSNRYFYQNKLRAFPYFGAEEPIEVIDLKGVYAHRVNKIEAKYAAELIAQKVKKDNFNFGLVAFSQKQLNEILDHLPKDVLGRIMERENEILLSALEDVQGEQCDHLIISLGYGYNQEGRFIRQFGPLNKDGGHRRLNVLMSRARKKITFIRSVDEHDFPISENDGVDMLRKLMLYLTQCKEQKESAKGKDKNEMVFPAFYKNEPEALNLLTRHNVLLQRNWQLKYTF